MLRYMGKDAPAALFVMVENQKQGKCPPGGGWHIPRMQYYAERGKSGFTDTHTQTPPQYSKLKKKKEENSRIEYSMNLFSLTEYTRRCREESNLTGEIVRVFYFSLSLCFVWIFHEHILLLSLEKGTHGNLSVSDLLKISKKKRNKEKHIHTHCCPHLPNSWGAFKMPWNQSSEHLTGTSASNRPSPPSVEQLKFQ